MNEPLPNLEHGPLIVAASPHIQAPDTVARVMKDVALALLPATAAALIYFRLPALAVIAAAVTASVLAEYAWQKALGIPVRVNDYSAALTGLFLALTLPPHTPWWMVVIGAFVSIILGKQVFGGLGHNPFNPALVGRAFLQISWPQALTSWVTPFDGLSTATPLAQKAAAAWDGVTAATAHAASAGLPSYFDLFIGNRAGSLGETSAAALIAGGLFLVLRGHIRMVIPAAYILTVALGAMAFGLDPLFHALAGGLMLGAFYMATDPATSPVSGKGKLVFGAGCGLLTILIRAKGGFPEGVCFAILIMNIAVPLIDRWTIPKPLGVKR